MQKIILFVLASILFSVNSQAADWSVFANISDPNGQICKFDMPISDFFSSTHYFSKIKKQKPRCTYSINLEGPFELNDIHILDRLVEYLKANPDVKRPAGIGLNSPGGSVFVALRIALEIRDPHSPLYKLSSFVGSSEVCYSSCVLIVAASFQRGPYGEIGIHRPYFVGDEYKLMGYDTLQKAYDGLYDNLAIFFKKTNIHPSILDDMWFVSSNKIKILTKAELRKYGLSKKDMVMEEQRLMKLRTLCGENAIEIEKRFESEVNSKCRASNGWIDYECRLKVIKNNPLWLECDKKIYPEKYKR